MYNLGEALYKGLSGESLNHREKLIAIGEGLVGLIGTFYNGFSLLNSKQIFAQDIIFPQEGIKGCPNGLNGNPYSYKEVELMDTCPQPINIKYDRVAETKSLIEGAKYLKKGLDMLPDLQMNNPQMASNALNGLLETFTESRRHYLDAFTINRVQENLRACDLANSFVKYTILNQRLLKTLGKMEGMKIQYTDLSDVIPVKEIKKYLDKILAQSDSDPFR